MKTYLTMNEFCDLLGCGRTKAQAILEKSGVDFLREIPYGKGHLRLVDISGGRWPKIVKAKRDYEEQRRLFLVRAGAKGGRALQEKLRAEKADKQSDLFVPPAQPQDDLAAIVQSLRDQIDAIAGLINAHK